MTRRNWRELKAARISRELRRERIILDRTKSNLYAAQREAEVARNEPLNRLSQAAISHLSDYTAEAIRKATDGWLKRTLEEVDRIGLNRLKMRSHTRWEDRMTVFTVFLPETHYSFTADLGSMLRFDDRKAVR